MCACLWHEPRSYLFVNSRLPILISAWDWQNKMLNFNGINQLINARIASTYSYSVWKSVHVRWWWIYGTIYGNNLAHPHYHLCNEYQAVFSRPPRTFNNWEKRPGDKARRDPAFISKVLSYWRRQRQPSRNIRRVNATERQAKQYFLHQNTPLMNY